MNITRAYRGWRINLVTRNHRIYGFRPDGLTAPARCHPAQRQDNVLHKHHRSPHTDCECGWRLITNSQRFPEYFDGIARHWWRDRVAIQVETVGPTLPGVDSRQGPDPHDTIRARQLRWIPGSKIVIPGRLAALTEPLAANYPGRVVVLPSRDWSAFTDVVSETEVCP
ncbi:hypothetical protein F8M49_25030 [Rhodococcus zopfii]|uniref:Uncharacterized protein n=1 Tax=Rhodococcus zopfii TaxID=43772 RepID=A0ABU3WV10_9NOCA|nr:hypothetical protein [Rhodococcus zopfii]